MNTHDRFERVPVIIAPLLVASAFLFFQLFYKYHLYHREQMMLFMMRFDSIIAYLSEPACFSKLAGDFLTQFFYFVGMGAAILSAILGLLYLSAFSVLKKLLPIKYAILVAVSIFIFEAFRNMSHNYQLSSTISLLAAFALMRLVMRFGLHRYRYQLIALPLLYWLIGYGVWVYALLMLIFLSGRQFKLKAALLSFYALFMVFNMMQFHTLTFEQSYMAGCGTWFSKPNFRMERLYGMSCNVYFNKWNLVRESLDSDSDNNMINTYFYNLCNMQSGTMAGNLTNYYQPFTKGLFLDVNHKSSLLALEISNDVWFGLGDMTMAEHSSMVAMINTPAYRSSRMMRRLAEINIIKGDEQAAGKYLRILRSTIAHRKWAEARGEGRRSDQYKKWVEMKRGFINKDDRIRAKSDYVSALRALLDSNPGNKNALDYLLCYHLLQKDLPSFVRDYKRWGDKKQVPEPVFQEAWLAAYASSIISDEEVGRLPVMEDIYQRFSDYTKLYNETGGDGHAMTAGHSSTYWFYYHYAVRNTQEILD